MNIPAPLADYDTEYTQPVRETLFKTAEYLNQNDRELLERACAYAFHAHHGIKRKSGEPYITHPIAVTIELARWGMDVETLCAGLMHDVIEDTPITTQEMAAEFGNVITNMVDGLSKLEKLQFANKNEHFAASFQKLILAMTRDVRTIIVKLSDRLHNMRTLEGVDKPLKRRLTSEETMEVYAPIALRLGMSEVYREMQEIAFQHIHPERYKVLRHAVNGFRYEHESVIKKAIQKMQAALDAKKIPAIVQLAPPKYFSVYQKMKKRKVGFDKITDLLHVHVICKTELDCYVALGVLHKVYPPQMGKIKDLIAVPNANNYQSLHTVLKMPYQKRNLELSTQIRTEEMDAVAKYGITAISPTSEHSLRTHNWLQNVSDLHNSSADAIEFLENMKTDLFPVEAYIFTPKGEIINIQRGATVIDFAYAVHTKVGNRCVAAKVNGQLVPLRTKLRSGNTVEIITSDNAHPSPTWLSFVVTARARTAIRSYMKNVNRQEAIEHGGVLLAKTLDSLLPKAVVASDDVMKQYLKHLEEKGLGLDDIKFQIGAGQLLPIAVAQEITDLAGDIVGDKQAKLDTVLVHQHDSVRIRLAECCRPISGDVVGGVIVAGEGLMVHRDTCEKFIKTSPEQQLAVDWGHVSGSLNVRYEVGVRVLAQDGHGLLAALSSAISQAGGNIATVSTLAKAEKDHDFIEFLFTVNVSDVAQLGQVMSRLQHVPHVREVVRV